MLRSKREVDQHVEQLEAKIQSETERNLKAFSIAKLYFAVGDYESARRYLDKYLTVRNNSSGACKLQGQVMECLRQRENAIAAYKKAYELDPTSKDALTKICELIVADAGAPDFDADRARYGEMY